MALFMNWMNGHANECIGFKSGVHVLSIKILYESDKKCSRSVGVTNEIKQKWIILWNRIDLEWFVFGFAFSFWTNLI